MCVQHEDALAQAAFEEARRRTRDFEDRDRSHREDLEVRGPGTVFPSTHIVHVNRGLLLCHLKDKGTA